MSTLGKQVSPRTAALSIGLLVVISAAVIAVMYNNARRSESARDEAAPARVSGRPRPHKVKTVAKRTDANTRKAALRVTDVSSDSDPYAVIVDRNLFKAVSLGGIAAPSSPGPGGHAARPGGKGSTMPLGVPRGGPPPGMAGPLPPMPIGPRPGGNPDEMKRTVAFTGVIDTPTGTKALLENLATKEARFAASGESAFGFRVQSITDRTVLLEKDGMPFSLDLGENKSDADGGSKPGGTPPGGAPPGGPQPGPPGGPQPGQPGGPPPGMMRGPR